MINKRIMHELEGLLIQRGEVTPEQREYAKTELMAMKELSPITNPSKELRIPHRRTLKSYIGETIFNELVDGRSAVSLFQNSLLTAEV